VTAISVYCAGKIAKNDWRHELFPTLRSAVSAGAYNTSEQPDLGPDLLRDGSPGRFQGGDVYLYGGPFFLSCDHGCAHGRDTHGQGPNACFDVPRSDHGVTFAPETVAARCLEWLRWCDVVFVWLDSPTAYGTIAEIGYARGIGLPVFCYHDSRRAGDLTDMWFAAALCDVRGEAPDPYQAWGRFVADLAPHVPSLGQGRNAYLDRLKRPEPADGVGGGTA